MVLGIPSFSHVGLVVIFAFRIQNLVAIYPAGCSYKLNLELNKEYTIYYNNYPRYTDCLWSVTSPAGSIINMYCPNINIPASNGCNGDQLVVSLTGDTTFRDGEVYCGTGTLTLTSKNNAVAVELFATSNSSGGNFQCTLRAQATCNCGWKGTTRIVGGSPTKVNEYPMMVGLIDVSTSREPICGGTIISLRYILTAAHCSANIILQYMFALVGDFDYSTGTDTAAAKLYNITNIIVHPEFNWQQQINDLAILKTQVPIEFSLLVGPACLPFRYSNTNFTGQYMTYLGWGQDQFFGAPQEQLHKVDVQVISNYACSVKYAKPINSRLICAYTPNHDACQGDSGGPSLWQDSSSLKIYLIGVISYGRACGLLPGVNAYVPSYISWIVSQTPDATYCIPN